MKDGKTTGNLIGLLTIDSNTKVGPINPKAMPVILTDLERLCVWLSEPWTAAQLSKGVQVKEMPKAV